MLQFPLLKERAKVSRSREVEIKEQLDDLDQKICNSRNLEDVNSELKQYEELKNELKLLYDEKGKAAILSSKCKWVENGEKATKYFINLEKRNYNRKVITEIESENGSLIKDDKQILEKVEAYYEYLYS